MAFLVLQQQISAVVTEAVLPAKPKILIIWLFTESMPVPSLD